MLFLALPYSFCLIGWLIRSQSSLLYFILFCFIWVQFNGLLRICCILHLSLLLKHCKKFLLLPFSFLGLIEIIEISVFLLFEVAKDQLLIVGFWHFSLIPWYIDMFKTGSNRELVWSNGCKSFFFNFYFLGCLEMRICAVLISWL